MENVSFAPGRTKLDDRFFLRLLSKRENGKRAIKPSSLRLLLFKTKIRLVYFAPVTIYI